MLKEKGLIESAFWLGNMACPVFCARFIDTLYCIAAACSKTGGFGLMAAGAGGR
jgi:hypothetical protein